MATINDLDISNLANLTDDELTQLIQKRRAKRRSPDKEVKARSVKKAIATKSRGKSTSISNMSKQAENMSPAQAAELLKLLGGKVQGDADE